ncbi:MAG: hypothetical protein Q4D52_06110 [Eubacteriales bacterium]|nr:hypothetical protein [Eubacteriales bacterium]
MEILQIIGGILLLLLKIIGIALLVVLLLLLLLLFVPLAWKLKATHLPDTALTEAQGGFEIRLWAGFARLTVSYQNEAELRLRILGFTVWRQSLTENEEAAAEETGTGQQEAEETGQWEAAHPAVQEESPETAELASEMDGQAGDVEKKRLPFGAWIKRGVDRLCAPLHRLYQKVRSLWQRIKEIITGMLQKSELGIAYWDWLHSRPVRNVLDSLLLTVRKLLWHIRPRRGRGWLVFGIGDPMYTALLYGLTMEWWTMKRMNVDAEPSLEERKIDGELGLRGHLIPAYPIWLALRLVLKKDLRRSLATRPGHRNTKTEQTNDGRTTDETPNEDHR